MNLVSPLDHVMCTIRKSANYNLSGTDFAFKSRNRLHSLIEQSAQLWFGDAARDDVYCFAAIHSADNRKFFRERENSLPHRRPFHDKSRSNSHRIKGGNRVKSRNATYFCVT